MLSLSANGLMANGLKLTGGVMIGNLSMGGNKITDISDPIDDGDVSNKKYVNTEIKSECEIMKLKIDAKLDKNIQGHLNMNGFSIVNVLSPRDQFDAVNKLYLQVHTQEDDLTIEKLLHIANKIDNIYYKYGTIHREEFFNAWVNLTTLFSRNPEFVEVFSGTLFTDLKVVIITIVETLPEEVFLDLKSQLKGADLVQTPEEKTLRRKYRRFINKSSKTINPDRTNSKLELLVQKNLLLIDVGFVYIFESLMNEILGKN
jgi:hypothetical protein